MSTRWLLACDGCGKKLETTHTRDDVPAFKGWTRLHLEQHGNALEQGMSPKSAGGDCCSPACVGKVAAAAAAKVWT